MGDSVFRLANPTSLQWPRIASYVPDHVQVADEAVMQVLAAGAVSVQEPIKKQDDAKQGGVQEVGGTTWWIATKVEPSTKDHVMRQVVSKPHGAK